MKYFKNLILSLVIFSFVSLSQNKEEVIYYSQNNTGFPFSLSNFIFDGYGNLLLTHYHYNDLNRGGLTIFDGLRWKLTTKGANGYPFDKTESVTSSQYDGSIYVYGGINFSDGAVQRYGIARFNSVTNTWTDFGDTTIWGQSSSALLDDMLINENGELFVAHSSGFYKVTEENYTRYTLPDNIYYFSPSEITFDNNGGIFVARNWSDGWGNSFAGLYYFNGSVLDTLLNDPLDSINVIDDMIVDASGNLWILGSSGTQYGNDFLMKYSPPGSVSYYHFPDDISIYRHQGEMAFDGNYIWTYGTNKLLRFDVTTNEYELFDFYNPISPWNTPVVKKIVAFGNYVYLSDGGFAIIKVDKTSGQIVGYYSSSNTGLPGVVGGTDIKGVKISPDNHYWFFSLNHGISCFNGDYWKTFGTLEINGGLIVGVYDLAVTEDNNVIIVSDSIRVWNENDGWKSYFPPEDIISSGMYALSVVAEDNNTVWVADQNHGLLKFNLETHNFQIFRGDVTGGTAPSKLFLDSENNLWIGFAHSTPTLYDGSQFHHFTASDGIEGSNTTDFTQTSNGDIWVSFLNNGVAKFHDGNWTSFTPNNSNIGNYQIRAIAADKSGNIWIGTDEIDSLSLYHTTDGVNWTKKCIYPSVSDGILGLTVDENNNIIINTFSSGVFVYNQNQIVLGSNNNGEDKLNNFLLSQNYPNPFNPSTTIEYSIPVVRSFHSIFPEVRLIVYDVLGRKIATLVNKKQSPGKYSVKFDASNLPSGIYFYTLCAGDFVATKKMILMK